MIYVKDYTILYAQLFVVLPRLHLFSCIHHCTHRANIVHLRHECGTCDGFVETKARGTVLCIRRSNLLASWN